MIEPRSIQLQWFNTSAPLTTRPQKHICSVHMTKINYQNHVLNFIITSFWRVCPKPRDVASLKMQVHNFINFVLIKKSWIQHDLGLRKPMANYIIEPKSIQSQRFHMKAKNTKRDLVLIKKNMLDSVWFGNEKIDDLLDIRTQVYSITKIPCTGAFNCLWTKSRMDKIQNWTKSRIEQNPEMDKIPNGQKSRIKPTSKIEKVRNNSVLTAGL